jgi:hypothetical protein
MKRLALFVGATLAQVILAASSAQAATVVNGDFSGGATGFVSGYAYKAPARNALWGEGTYTVAGDPHAVHDLWKGFGDHTSGNGEMLIVNGAPDSNVLVWGETVSGLSVGRTYAFDFWLASSFPASPADISLMVNGASVGSSLASSTTGSWRQVTKLWTATSTSATLGLYDLNTARNGNDFAIDDIALNPAGVPETATWMMLVAGIGAIGSALRGQRQATPRAPTMIEGPAGG